MNSVSKAFYRKNKIIYKIKAHLHEMFIQGTSIPNIKHEPV